MAEEEKNDQKQVEDEVKTGGKGLFRLLMLAGVVLVAAGAGFGVAQMMGGPKKTLAEEMVEEETATPDGPDTEYQYVEFEPVTVNLNVPNVNRFIRTTLILAIRDDKKTDIKLVKDTIEKHKPQLMNMLTVYLAGKTLDDVRGTDKLNSIRAKIFEKFNDKLWPDRKPLINHVLFKEFKIQ